MGKIRKNNHPFGSKKLRKLIEGKCRLCGEENYNLLDVHRIKEGSDGGKYSYDNTITICVSCHRMHHAGEIKILKWYNSTFGRTIHWIDKSGNEKFS